MNAVQKPCLVLASQSIRRYQLLQQLGFEAVCRPVDVDESPDAQESPLQLVKRLARLKAITCLQRQDTTIPGVPGQAVFLAADTIIDLDGNALGKPRDKADCLSMLLALSNREHVVHSGVCVIKAAENFQRTMTVSTRVRFGEIVPLAAEEYWHTGEPQGKAGSYAIQGVGAQFVAHLSGSYSNVVGLPLYETAQLLGQAGIKAL